MPAIDTDSLVLLTGGSGYLAVHCLLGLLRQGHTVRTTVRSQEKGEYLSGLFDSKFPGKFHFTIVKDVEEKGAFDEAVKDVVAVVHTASPFHFNAKGRALEALVYPAVNGTKNVLESIQKSPSVKRVVITSSNAAITDPAKPPKLCTEEDWNESSPAGSKKEGNDQDPQGAYRASKTLAERFAWDFVATNKPAWDLVTICPPLILGPLLHQVAGPESLNTSVGAVWAWTQGIKKEDELPGAPGSVVDVRDVAEAHVKSLVIPAAGGQRYATSRGMWTWQEVVDLVHASTTIPESWKKTTPVGKPGSGKDVVQPELSGAKAHRDLGIQYKSLQETIEGTVLSLIEYQSRGWKGEPSIQ